MCIDMRKEILVDMYIRLLRARGWPVAGTCHMDIVVDVAGNAVGHVVDM